MPDIYGTDVLRKLKDDPRYKDIPIIIVTSKFDTTTEALCFELGAASFIKKPFTKSNLRVIEDILSMQPD
jgi:CheY-like chemotaxis protein